MREIKFRAWFDEQNVIFEKPYLEAEYTVLAFQPQKEELQGICRLGYDNCIPDHIEQFTGLLDKNGKEIYEGDIAYDEESRLTFVIEYNQESASFVKKLVNSVHSLPFGKDDKDLSVIGNIHDNGEILKGEHNGKAI